jgi:hypothetical protein
MAWLAVEDIPPDAASGEDKNGDGNVPSHSPSRFRPPPLVSQIQREFFGETTYGLTLSLGDRRIRRSSGLRISLQITFQNHLGKARGEERSTALNGFYGRRPVIGRIGFDDESKAPAWKTVCAVFSSFT